MAWDCVLISELSFHSCASSTLCITQRSSGAEELPENHHALLQPDRPRRAGESSLPRRRAVLSDQPCCRAPCFSCPCRGAPKGLDPEISAQLTLMGTRAHE